MSDTTTNLHYNQLSATAREQRAGDVSLQQRALEILQEKLGERMLEWRQFRDDITITICPEDLRATLAELRDNATLQFNSLSSITGIDYSRYGYPAEWGQIRFGVVYNLFSYPNRANFAVRVVVPEEATEIPSIFDMWHTADWQEREIYDLLGVRFPGHPDLRRLFLYDDFEGEYPQRKDYPLRGKGERDRSWRHVQRRAKQEE